MSLSQRSGPAARPKKKARETVSTADTLLVQRASTRVEWIGDLEELGENARGGQPPTELRQWLRENVQRLAQCNPAFWFVDDHGPAAVVRWKNAITGPVEILRETHGDSELLRHLCAPGVSAALHEAALEQLLKPGNNTCSPVAMARVRQRVLHQIGTVLAGAELEQLKAELAEHYGADEQGPLERIRQIQDDAGRFHLCTLRRFLADKRFFSFLSSPGRASFQLPADGLGDPCESRPTEEQRGALRKVLTQLAKAGWAVLSGPGGSGKTHLLRSVRVLARQVSAKVCFLGPTNRAVAVLQDGLADVRTDADVFGTIHSITRRPDLQPFDCVVIDESSMLASEHMDLVVHCAVFKRAAFLFVGDHLQLPPVGPGEVLRPLLRAAGDESAHLTKNMRATNQQLAAMVEGVRGGQLVDLAPFTEHFQDRLAVLQGILRAGCDLVLCLRNEERIRYNAFVMKRHRVEPTESHLAKYDDYRNLKEDWVPSDKLPRTFVPFVGLPVRLQTNEFKPKFCRGSLGRIDKVVTRGHDCTLRVVFPEQPEALVLSSAFFQIPAVVRPAYATTLHDAQGCQERKIGIFLPPQSTCPLLNLESLYTAVSRAKEDVRFFTCGDSLESMRPAMRVAHALRLTPLALMIQRARSETGAETSETHGLTHRNT